MAVVPDIENLSPISPKEKTVTVQSDRENHDFGEKTQSLNIATPDVQKLVEYAGKLGVQMKKEYAREYIARSGGVDAARTKVDGSVNFALAEQKAGRKIRNMKGILEQALSLNDDVQVGDLHMPREAKYNV